MKITSIKINEKRKKLILIPETKRESDLLFDLAMVIPKENTGSMTFGGNDEFVEVFIDL